MTPAREEAIGTGVGGRVSGSIGFSMVPMRIASFTTAMTTRPAARLATISSAGASLVCCCAGRSALAANAAARNAKTGEKRFRAGDFFARMTASIFSRNRRLFGGNRLDRGDGDDMDDVVGRAPAGEIVRRPSKTLENRSERDSAGETFDKFVRDVAGIKIREDKDVGA